MRLWCKGRILEEGKAWRSAFWCILKDDCATDYRTFIKPLIHLCIQSMLSYICRLLFVSNRYLSIWACFICWTFEQCLQPDSSIGVAKFLTKLSSLFSQKHLWTLGSLKKTLFISEYIYPRGSRRRKWKSCRWMQNKVFLYYYLDLSSRHAQDD